MTPDTCVADSTAIPDLVRLPPTGGPLRVARSILSYETVHALQFIDITHDVERVVAMSGITEGTVTVFSRHTTAAIKINEHEPELLKDLAQLLASVAPDSRSYFHNDFTVRWANMVEDECPNGHAHCQHLLLGTSETIPLVDGQLMFGRWQRIFMIELDHARSRDVAISVMGC
ncbi:MAG TPA: secondary thiamine-phosphate synthase enzyme YjbQ [Chloroflexota bacterium]|nr:secondary thiamine-phosphate synthase enzyme YjbQ [Chloroflexota bacterium]